MQLRILVPVDFRNYVHSAGGSPVVWSLTQLIQREGRFTKEASMLLMLLLVWHMCPGHRPQLLASAWVLSFLFLFDQVFQVSLHWQSLCMWHPTSIHVYIQSSSREQEKHIWLKRGLSGSRIHNFSGYVLHRYFLTSDGSQGAYSSNASMDNSSCRFK